MDWLPSTSAQPVSERLLVSQTLLGPGVVKMNETQPRPSVSTQTQEEHKWFCK